MLATSAFCLQIRRAEESSEIHSWSVISIRKALPRVELFVPGKAFADNGPSTLTKRTDPAPTDANVGDYLARCPRNQIPDWVTTTDRRGDDPHRYNREQIWAAMHAGIQQYNRWIENPNEATNPRLRAPGGERRAYPHDLAGREDALHGVNTGAGNYNQMWTWPLIHPTLGQAAIWRGAPDPPDLDRGTLCRYLARYFKTHIGIVIFDTNGFYIGVATHRGENDNELHWGTPTDGGSLPLDPVDLARFPGVPVTPWNFLPSTPRRPVLDGNWVDAAQPAVPAWNVFGLTGGGVGGGSGGGLRKE